MTDLVKLLEDDPVGGLREIAKLMRERAAAATPGPWLTVDSEMVGLRTEDYVDVVDAIGSELDDQTWANTAHIASWHPAVALAAAKLLERWAWLGGHDPDLLHRVGADEVLALARVYAGGGQ